MHAVEVALADVRGLGEQRPAIFGDFESHVIGDGRQDGEERAVGVAGLVQNLERAAVKHLVLRAPAPGQRLVLRLQMVRDPIHPIEAVVFERGLRVVEAEILERLEVHRLVSGVPQHGRQAAVPDPVGRLERLAARHRQHAEQGAEVAFSGLDRIGVEAVHPDALGAQAPQHGGDRAAIDLDVDDLAVQRLDHHQDHRRQRRVGRAPDGSRLRGVVADERVGAGGIGLLEAVVVGVVGNGALQKCRYLVVGRRRHGPADDPEADEAGRQGAAG